MKMKLACILCILVICSSVQAGWRRNRRRVRLFRRTGWLFRRSRGGTNENSCSKVCPKNYSPVCGSDDVTYGNRCAFNRAKCRVSKLSRKMWKRMSIAYSGKCKRRKGNGCSRKCFTKYKPVCGSNGVVYSNVCLLKVAKCQQRKSGKKLYQVNLRKCKKGSKCPSVCTKKFSPVCGSNGRSYRNVCYFNSARCSLKRFGKTIKIAYYRKCYRTRRRGWTKGLRCTRKCYMYYSPVCGSDGKTYWNMCVFKSARCRINNRKRRFRYARRRFRRWRYTSRRLRYAYRGRCKRRRRRPVMRRPVMTVKTIINMSK